MTDTPTPVTPRTDRAALYVALMRLGRSVQRWRWWDEKAESWVETDSADFGDAIADRCDGILAEREAAVPAATEALRRIADEGWERSRKPGDDAAVLAEMAETALASPEPTPDSGLDVERLAAPLHDWLLVYNKDRQPYPGQCTGTHMIGMGDCQFAARAIRARLSSADPSESSA